MFDSLSKLPQERRWRQQYQPAPVVVAIIRREASESAGHSSSQTLFLLIQRNGDTYSGQWALVGGKWDFGETLAEAITREVEEETGLEAELVAVRGIVSERLAPTNSEAVGAHFVIFVCDLLAPNGNAVEQKEGAVAWFTWNQIEALRQQQAIIPSDYAMLASFAETAETVPHIEAEMAAAIGTEQDNLARLLRFERVNEDKS